MRRLLSSSIIILFFMSLSGEAISQQESDSAEQVRPFRWMPLPIVGYDADMGFQFGALAQFFFYGDGSTYPNYKHMLYAEFSLFTKGTSNYQLFYDTKHLIPGIRFTMDVSYLTEKALDFYGFNGYEAKYNPAYEDEESEDYISRVFYRHERKLFRVIADFQGPVIGQKLRWLGGINFFDIRVGTVDIDRLNRGKDEEDRLPDVPLLYDHYSDFGIISEDERDGGVITYLKAGLVFDTRDHEAAPTKGIWSEVLLLAAPSFLANTGRSYLKLAAAHRQYISLVRNRLVLAYRLAYQGTIAGNAPFYIQPYMYSSYSLTTRPDGLGGAKTLRGVLRNRVVGEGIVYGNLELRLKTFRLRIFRQQLEFVLHGFTDAGQVVKPHPVDRSLVPFMNMEDPGFFDQSFDSMHLSYGLGLHLILEKNFVVAIDYGFPADSRDGTGGLYLTVGNIF